MARQLAKVIGLVYIDNPTDENAQRENVHTQKEHKKLNRFEREVGEIFKAIVPNLIVFVYGFILLASIVLIFFLLKEDLTLLQQTLKEKLGIDDLLSKYNLQSFDQHFNKYASKLIEQLQNQTNIELPIDPKYNTTTFYSISQYVSQMLNDPNTLYSVSPLKWNITLR